MREFHIEIEAELGTPLSDAGTGALVHHYFRNYEVAARSIEEAESLVVLDLQAEGDHLVEGRTWDVGRSWARRAAIKARSGRIFFSTDDEADGRAGPQGASGTTEGAGPNDETGEPRQGS